MSLHQSVLVNEVLEYLEVKKDRNYIDGTFGQGGHSKNILENNGDGKLLAIDADIDSYQLGQDLSKQFNNRLLMFTGNFFQVDEFVDKTEIKKWDGALLDLGWSMDQFKTSARGFSFQEDETLDMRYSMDLEITAKDIVNKYKEEDLANLIYNYGEEIQSRRIARFIVEARKEKAINTSGELAEIVKKAIPKRFQSKRLHPATLVFQALRIAVNKELDVLEGFLEKILSVMNDDGRVVIISFHSLEDRIVKHTFKKWKAEGLGQIITKRPIMASEEELNNNPASRSAKLRCFQKKSKSK